MRPIAQLSLCVAVLICGSLATPNRAEEPLRLWTDSSGNRQLRASLEGVEGDSVRLTKPDGTHVSLPLDRLSKLDRDYLELIRNPNPFQPLDTPADCVVLAAHADWPDAATPGIVFYADDKRAYVYCPTLPALLDRLLTQKRSTAATSGDLPRPIVRWGSGIHARRVQVNMLSDRPLRGGWFLAAPRDDLPSPLRAANAAPAEGMKVRIAGYRRNETDGKVTHTEVRGQGVITQVITGPRPKSALAARQPASPVTAFLVEGIKEPVDCGVVLTEAGEPLGFITPTLTVDAMSGAASGGPPQPSNRFRYDMAAGQPPTAVRTIAVQSLARLDRLRDPECVDAVLAAVKGDVKHVTYDLAATVNDPFGVIESLRFDVSFADAISLQHAQGWVPGTWPVSRRVVEVAVARGKPSEKAAAQLAEQQHVLAEPTWTGRFEDENPGADYSVTYRLQPVVKVGGSEQRLAACAAQYCVAPRRFGPATGLQAARDSRLRRPAVGLAAAGEACRRRLPDHRRGHAGQGAAVAPKSRFPKPQTKGKSLAGEQHWDESWQVTEIKLPAERIDAAQKRALMLFSPDGNWLFVADATNVLHKINTANFVEEASLNLDGDCTELSYSQAGLLAAMYEAGQLWIIDPQTLEVTRALSLPGVLRVAGSPGTSKAFAICRPTTRVAGQPFDKHTIQLVMLDLAGGRILHRVEPSPGGYPVTVAGHSLFAGEEGGLFWQGDPSPLAMSIDGRYLFMGGRHLARMRVEGEDLVYEEGAYDVPADIYQVGCILGADGHWAIVPSRGVLANHDGLTVIDPLHLTEKKCRLEVVSGLDRVAVEGKSGNVLVSVREGIHIFGPGGNHIAKLGGLWGPHTAIFPRIVASPQGGQFVITVSRDQLGYFRNPADPAPKGSGAQDR